MKTFGYAAVESPLTVIDYPLVIFSGFLEREMKLLFGSRLRAEGGDGTLNLEE